ncbi:MAG: C25 family peptidase propeptide domain-containing protein, partial [Candidatus Thorarchaeota archaeon]
MKKVSWTRKKLILKIAVIAIAAMFLISSASPTALVEYPNGTGFVTEEEHGLVKDTYEDRPCIVKSIPAEGGDWVSLDGNATPPGTPAKGCVIVSDTTGITIVVDFYGFWRNAIGINGSTYDDIVMPGATQNHENATPMLPMLSEFLEIPHCTDISIEWISSSSTILSGYYIRPAPPPQVPVTFEGNSTADYYMSSVYGAQFATAYLPTKEGPAYSTNAFFPDNASVISIEGEECANPVIMRGHRLLTLNTYGAQYNNPSHELRVYSQIVFKIKYSYETQIEPIPESLRSEAFERILFDLLMNYNPINIRTGPLSNIPGLGEVRPDTGGPGTRTADYPLASQLQVETTDYSLSSGLGAWTANYPLASQPQVETTDYSLSSGPPSGMFNFPLASDPPPGYVEGAEYLIITGIDSQLQQQAERLAAWKTRKGTLSKVITVNPNVEDIAAIISNAYETWYPAPTYVVFFGDVEIIPATY